MPEFGFTAYGWIFAQISELRSLKFLQLIYITTSFCSQGIL